MHTANKLAKKFIYATFILPCSSLQRVRQISQTVDVYPENTSLSPNAGIILARVVDGGPTLIQHWSFVKGESCLLTLSVLAALKRYL